MSSEREERKRTCAIESARLTCGFPALIATEHWAAAIFRLGRPTGSAMPLMWAHAEYIKFLRSVSDGRVFDLIPDVAGRYLGDRKACQLFEIWKTNRRVRAVKKGYTLRVQASDSFRLRWTGDEWTTVKDTPSSATTLGIEFVDIPIIAAQRAPIRFTFLWTKSNSWEGRDYVVEIKQ